MQYFLVPHLSLHLVLSAEGAVVFTVLRDFHLLDSFPQAGTISGTILSGDTNLLSPLGHHASDGGIPSEMHEIDNHNWSGSHFKIQFQ